jgi:hypothetical protein
LVEIKSDEIGEPKALGGSWKNDTHRLLKKGQMQGPRNPEE